VASVQHMSALNGVWVVGATRSGIERNPITGSQLYYNGGSSIWSPLGHKLVQASVVPPETLPPGLKDSSLPPSFLQKLIRFTRSD
jgi:hypothetical protein